MIMKRLLILFIAVFGIAFSGYAQQKTKIADGIWLVRYGNTSVLEDDIHQKTWRIVVTREKKSVGDWVYTVACGNKYTKTVAKHLISGAVAAGVASASGGTVPASLTHTIAGYVYDDVCEYFGENR